MHKHKVYLVSSSHLDREWYAAADVFRVQAAHILDRVLLLLEKHPKTYSFMLDGQVNALEDYLEAHPEREEDISRFVKEGRLLIGPWYIQPDEVIPFGESLVRNLLLGRRIARRYGEPMNIGYLPDCFGHIAQMPQLLNQWGIHTAFTTRGLPPESEREVVWEAPDGSRVVTVFLEYGNCCQMNFDDMSQGIRLIGETDKLARKIEEIIQMVKPEPVITASLATYCSDLCAPAPGIVDMVEEINRTAENYEVIMGNLQDFFNEIQCQNPTLRVLTGELRHSPDIDYLKDTLAARSYLKVRNQRAQSLVETAETLCSLSWMAGDEYPRGFLDMAWKNLLLNHTHDGICGCSADVVHREMLIRFEKCGLLSEKLAEEAMKYLTDRIDTDTLGEKEKALVLFNSCGFDVEEPVVVEVPWKTGEKAMDFSLLDPDGKEISWQCVGKDTIERIESDMEAVQRFYTQTSVKMAFRPGKIPAKGYKTFRLVPGREVPSAAYEEDKVCSGFNYMENQYVRVSFHDDGTLDITDRENGRCYRGLHYFQDSGDAGDVYNYSKPVFDSLYDSRNLCWGITQLEDGPLAASFLLETEMLLPESLDESSQTRSSHRVANHICCQVTLLAGSRIVQVKTQIHNQSRDHRLRVVFPTGIQAEKSCADGQFHIDERPVEGSLKLLPQQAFVDICDEKAGLAVFNKGIHQYEVLKEEGCTIALTLLKCQGRLYRSFFKLPDRNFQEAQCQGDHTFEYALYPHTGTWQEAKVHQKAWGWSTGICSRVTGKHPGNLPLSCSFIRVESGNLVLSAVKQSEDGKRLVLRLYNASNQELKGRLSFFKPYRSACLLDLKEEALEDMVMDKGVLEVSAKPYGIMTIGIELS